MLPLGGIKRSECDDRKIEGNKGKTGGACAPFRRLHLCDKNLQNINNYDKINNTHNLLLEVCLAAKYEGQSISLYYPRYQTKYKDSGSTFTMCTMLARSFADIGDIIRGKDLFIGYNQKDRKEKKQLQQNLKNIFAKIYEKLKDKEGAETRYGSDTTNYYQLREDWWALNREKVWKAITCRAPKEAKYFRKTACNGGEGTNGQCHCIGGEVPTYFDYVPQFLRWVR
ncbi:pfEMP1 [Plasmodium falciparum HB3]|uniref:PfEMP1 n=1 Tax=Plasmodium falciparum (isolate HB3) TaxID=137071 RepID=A0A0L7KMG4_PLAFX|nr:pfEMP1 [Plasmodium falciparum HB3]